MTRRAFLGLLSLGAGGAFSSMTMLPLPAPLLLAAAPWSAPTNTTASLNTLVELFPTTIVLCYRASCDRHRPGGSLWSAAAQKRVIIIDGAATDAAQNADLLHCVATTSHGRHKFAPTLSHWRAVEMAATQRAERVLVLEADVVDLPSAAVAAVSRPDAYREALRRVVDGNWSVLQRKKNIVSSETHEERKKR